MKKFHKIKQKIIFCVMSVAVLLSVLITIIMSAGNISSTNTALLDNVQTTARIASQGISSNLHLLTERMYTSRRSRDLRVKIPMRLPGKPALPMQSSRLNLYGCLPTIFPERNCTAMQLPRTLFRTRNIFLI